MNSMMVSNRIIVGYTTGIIFGGMVILSYIINPFSVINPFSFFGQSIGCLALLVIYGTAYRSKHIIERTAVASCISIIASFWTFFIVSEEITGYHIKNQHMTPFIIGFSLAIILCVWPVSKIFADGNLLIIRSVVFTLFLAPVPYGPEGTLLPLIITLIFPPLIFLFIFLPRIMLSFFSILGLFSAIRGIGHLFSPVTHASSRFDSPN